MAAALSMPQRKQVCDAQISSQGMTGSTALSGANGGGGGRVLIYCISGTPSTVAHGQNEQGRGPTSRNTLKLFCGIRISHRSAACACGL